MPNWWCNKTWTYLSGPKSAAAAVAAVSVAFAISAIGVCSADAAEAAKTAAEAPVSADVTPPPMSVSAQYCASIVDKAADARFARQRAELVRVQKTIEERLGQLERKRAEFETWTKRREEFLAMVQGNLSTIYAKMKPTAAAEQLAKIDDMTAAAILLKLDPRATSAILTEMDPAKAADLARLFAAAGRSKPGKGS